MEEARRRLDAMVASTEQANAPSLSALNALNATSGGGQLALPVAVARMSQAAAGAALSHSTTGTGTGTGAGELRMAAANGNGEDAEHQRQRERNAAQQLLQDDCRQLWTTLAEVLLGGNTDDGDYGD